MRAPAVVVQLLVYLAQWSRADGSIIEPVDLDKEQLLLVDRFHAFLPNGSEVSSRCHFEIRQRGAAGGCDGAHVLQARVGQDLCFRWTCNIAQFGMRIESCAGNSHLGTQYPLIGADGCTMGSHQIGTPIYNENFTEAISNFRMFLYSTSEFNKIKCHVQLCHLCNCSDILPPANCADYGKVHVNLALANRSAPLPLCAPPPVASTPPPSDAAFASKAAVCALLALLSCLSIATTRITYASR